MYNYGQKGNCKLKRKASSENFFFNKRQIESCNANKQIHFSSIRQPILSIVAYPNILKLKAFW